ncbi:hypothetical protein [Halorussus caseinilyticus]|uniref:Uncharacterized protein n=1 Tax=Halorussus caseinilyticus TaxID=3034025 RepID=A0ABD5WJS6_9EURY
MYPRRASEVAVARDESRATADQPRGCARRNEPPGGARPTNRGVRSMDQPIGWDKGAARSRAAGPWSSGRPLSETNRR